MVTTRPGFFGTDPEIWLRSQNISALRYYSVFLVMFLKQRLYISEDNNTDAPVAVKFDYVGKKQNTVRYSR